jgi:RhoGEF domain
VSQCHTILLSREIKHIIDELISNEAIYVANLRQGIQNYVKPTDDPGLLDEIRENMLTIFGNIKEIYKLHATSLLPRLQSCNLDVVEIAETFTELIKYGDFYCYTLFMLSRERAQQLCIKHRDFFEELRTRCNDKLGVSSFLLQPIQRLPRYQLLLREIIKELAKLRKKIDVKPMVQSACIAEKMIERFLVMSNEALHINEIVPKDLVKKL